MVPKAGLSALALAWAAGAVFLAQDAAHWSAMTCVDVPRGAGESGCSITGHGFDWDALLTLAGAGSVLLVAAVVALWRGRWAVVAVTATLGVLGVMPATWEYLLVPAGEHLGL